MTDGRAWLPPAPKDRPAARSQTAAPAPVTSMANLLAVQRAAGNQATLALMRSTAGPAVIRRSWARRAMAGDWAWDAEVMGLEWYRDGEGAGAEYRFIFADKSIPEIASEEHQPHDAGWWASWAHAGTYWLPAFTAAAAPVPAAALAVAGPAVAGPAVAAGGAAAHAGDVADLADLAGIEADEADEEGEEGEDPDFDPYAIAAGTEYNGDPEIHSERAPQYAPTGAFRWPVTMSVAPAQRAVSWIIQEVVLTLKGRSATTFYEAFPLLAEQTRYGQGDVYQDPGGRGTAGTSTVKGLMQHHTFTDDGAPPGFVRGRVTLADDDGLSAAAKPNFWVEGAGTTHDLEVVWDDAAGTSPIATTPNGGAAVRKEDARQFDR